MTQAKKIFLTIVFGLIFSQLAFSQLDSLTNHCSSFIKYPYISDGQHYMALVLKDETAEFYFTFYGGATYRLVACTADSSVIPEIKVFDKDMNLLYSSDKYNNPRYWDFKFTSTVETVVQAKLPANCKQQSGLILLLLGFK